MREFFAFAFLLAAICPRGRHEIHRELLNPGLQGDIAMKKYLILATAAVAPVALMLTPVFMAASNAEDSNPEVQIIAHDLHIRERGSFGIKTWHEMDSSEFTAAMTAICTYFDCEPIVPLVSAGIHAGQLSVGKDYAISGVIHKHAGQEWFIAFPAPAGYVTCSATYDAKHISANQGDSTSGTVFRNPATGENWVGTYSEVPTNRPEGHWVDVFFVVKYVKAGTEGSHQCVPNGTRVWSVNLAK